MSRLRTPELDWARREATGEHADGDWVDVRVDPDAEPFSQVDVDGRVRFRHLPYEGFLPDAFVDELRAAHEAGELTLLEALTRMLARPEWLVRGRRLLLGPQTPVPALLVQVVEAFGIGPEVHAEDPERLVRITAMLAGFRPRRGELDAALRVLEEGAGLQIPRPALAGRADGRPPDEPLHDEVMACRDHDWWARRARRGARAELRIEGGWVRFQPSGRGQWGLPPGDIALAWDPEESVPHGLLRLLPAWACLRLLAPTATAVETP